MPESGFHTVWSLQKFSLTEFELRDLITLVTSLVKTML